MAGKSVLVCEDTALLRRVYADKLSQEGYAVHQAADGLECLEVARSKPVDLILLDLVMPRMSGLEALETLKRDPRVKDIPVIVLSNLGQESDIERCLELGAIDYMIKNSAKPADVTAKIRAALQGREESSQQTASLRVRIRNDEADADALVERARLTRGLWCPACEVELVLELVPKPERAGWYDAHLLCPSCDRTF